MPLPQYVHVNLGRGELHAKSLGHRSTLRIHSIVHVLLLRWNRLLRGCKRPLLVYRREAIHLLIRLGRRGSVDAITERANDAISRDLRRDFVASTSSQWHRAWLSGHGVGWDEASRKSVRSTPNPVPGTVKQSKSQLFHGPAPRSPLREKIRSVATCDVDENTLSTRTHHHVSSTAYTKTCACVVCTL